ncbi:integral membrane protein [Xylaria digitata]|nr:integral membrane protein [Xylaria digitata]
MSDFDPTTTPIAPPSPGEESNFLDPPSQAWMPRVAIYTTLPVAVAFIILRFYSRLHLRQKLQWEDYLCLAAGVRHLRHAKTAVNDVYGRHAWDIPLTALTTAYELLAVTILYSVASALVELSLLALFHRLFSPSTRSKILIRFGIVFTTVLYVAALVLCIYYNIPHLDDMGWIDPVFMSSVQSADLPLAVIFGILGTVTDLYVVAIPLASVARLKLLTSRKIGLAGLFATGFLVCGFSLALLIARVGFYRGVNKNSDFLWVAMQTYALAVSEVNLGIVCACVPVAFPILRLWARKLSSARSPLRSLAETAETSSIVAISPQRLPAVPRGTMWTLRFLLRISYSSRQEASRGITVTHVTDIERTPYYKGRPTGADDIYIDYNHLGSRDLGRSNSIIGKR